MKTRTKKAKEQMKVLKSFRTIVDECCSHQRVEDSVLAEMENIVNGILNMQASILDYLRYKREIEFQKMLKRLSKGE